MPFVMLYSPDKNASRTDHIPRTLEKIRDLRAAGKLLMTGGLANREKGAARIVLADGRYSVERAPAGESVLFGADGFAVLEAKDLEEAIELGQDFIKAAGDGTVELIEFFVPRHLPELPA